MSYRRQFAPLLYSCANSPQSSLLRWWRSEACVSALLALVTSRQPGAGFWWTFSTFRCVFLWFPTEMRESRVDLVVLRGALPCRSGSRSALEPRISFSMVPFERRRSRPSKPEQAASCNHRCHRLRWIMAALINRAVFKYVRARIWYSTCLTA